MSTLEQTYGKDGLVITFTKEAEASTLVWEGTSDDREPGITLAPLMKQLAEDRTNKVVTMDFRKLSFMNSASVSPIIQLIKMLNASQVTTTLIYDTTVTWQRINFQCMKSIAMNLQHVEVSAG